MFIELGQIYLWLAFAASLYTLAAAAAGRRWDMPKLADSARFGIYAVAALFTLSMGVIIHAFITKDFDLKIVSLHTSTELPAIYSLTALYADKSGAIFFWGWLLSVLAALFTWQKSRSHTDIMFRARMILAALLAFFIALGTFVTSVFAENTSPPLEGLGLNPQLQSIGMLLHPPLLYLGFCGFMIVFAFVMGGLLARVPTREWAEGARRWTLFSWCVLGLGNLVGAWWAYTELGWGGYWAWDPVENAGLFPWLLGTALVHSIAVSRRRMGMRLWSQTLTAFTFVFVLLSPFITHGGVESLLHGFSGSPLPPYLLGAIIISLAGSLLLIVIRHRETDPEPRTTGWTSLESGFVLMNIILVIIAGWIIAGTVFPRISDSLGDRVSLDRDFFDFFCGPGLLALVFLMGICPALRWRRTSPRAALKKLAGPFAIAAVFALIIWSLGWGNWYAVAALVCGLPLLAILAEWLRESRYRSQKENPLLVFPRLIWHNRPRYGGFIAHIGIILITLGVIGSSMYDTEAYGTLRPGEVMGLKGYELTGNGVSIEYDDEKLSATASVIVTKGSQQVAELHPERSFWFNQVRSSAEVAIRTTAREDLFVSLIDYDMETGSITIRVVVNPLVVWMWVGGGFILLGGIIAFWPDRKRAGDPASPDPNGSDKAAPSS